MISLSTRILGKYKWRDNKKLLEDIDETLRKLREFIRIEEPDSLLRYAIRETLQTLANARERISRRDSEN